MTVRASPALREIARVLLAVAAALLVGFLLTLAISDAPLAAYHALLTGGLPTITWEDGGFAISRVRRLGAVLEDATTLMLVGLAVAIPFRARQFSLGADGQLFVGALTAAAISTALSGPSLIVIPAACLAAMTTAFLYGLLAGVLKARFGANEIVVTLMLNTIAVQAFRVIIQHLLREPGSPRLSAPRLPDAAMLEPLLARTDVTMMLFVAIAVCLLAWGFLERTTLGYELRAVGENEAFAAQAGIPVGRSIMLSFAIGGAFAGLAGFHLSNALLNPLPAMLPPGLGFEGIVVALLARNDPRGIVVAALGYAYLRVGAQAMERSTDVSREMILVVQALMILFVVSDRLLPALAGLRRRMTARWRGPGAAPAGPS